MKIICDVQIHTSRKSWIIMAHKVPSKTSAQIDYILIHKKWKLVQKTAEHIIRVLV